MSMKRGYDIRQRRPIDEGIPKRVKIVEVGPRDGLQNEKQAIPADKKIEFINKLSETGLSVIEATAFVHPKFVPQMGDNKEVFSGIKKKEGINYPVLAPNLRGLEDAIKVGVEEVAIFVGATAAFCKANINTDSVAQALESYKPVIERAKEAGLRIRGYVSCVCGCPYQGYVDPTEVAYVANELYKMGCYEISLGDTIGVGTPLSTQEMLLEVMKYVPKERIAVHFHNTYGQALANILVSLQMGISTVDSSTAGLGGCPFAKKATGNISTEDVVYMMNGMDIETGVELEKLIDVGMWITDILDKKNNSNVALAISTQPPADDELSEAQKRAQKAAEEISKNPEIKNE
eukprot:CAMPEP_0117425952 /NCGR_PEP_ID=MMETSP0758-20121206/6157_1 /TAXON_ID=63605 /ORGANISM="Percolomonas cosmopolitus, Strain AE-1 (ATCC 50343)" /LENGTH=346 /DNA_ID=CAMNT_0005210817 /DNA_START=138 /DNA_END=1178 /DNA_ORIENTATION=-